MDIIKFITGKKYILTVFVILATIIAYSNHFNNEFHFDDSHTIVDNAFIRNIKNIGLFFTDGTTSSVLPQNQSYRPIVTASLAIDYWFAKGNNPFYFHLSMFIVFLLQGIILIFLFNKILTKNDSSEHHFLVAVCAAGWYMVHPANAETVNYIISRSDILSTFFVIVALAIYVYYPQHRNKYFYLIALAIGALAKPSAVMFAPILFFYILLFEEHAGINQLFEIKKKNVLFSTIKKSLPAFIASAALYIFIDKKTPPSWIPGGTSTWNYLITQPYVIYHYFETFFIPLKLSADTDWSALNSIWDIRFFAGMLFLTALLGYGIYCSNKTKYKPIAFGIFWFFLALIPTSSIIPLAEVLNDHRMYFPFVGLSLSVTYAVYLFIIKKINFNRSSFKYIGIILIIAVFSIYSFGTYQRNKVWKTEESLWYDVTIKSPKNGRGLMNYGLEKMSEGDYEKANSYFHRALVLTPKYHYLFINLGILKNAMGHSDSAAYYFSKAIEYGGEYANTHFYYGRYLAGNNNFEEAILELRKAINISPGSFEYRLLLLDTYDKLRRWDDLKYLANESLNLFPDNELIKPYLNHSEIKKNALDLSAMSLEKKSSPETLLNLSLEYYNEKRYTECIEAANKALQLKPDYAEAYNNIGAAYIALEDYTKALTPLKKAIELKPSFTLALNNFNIAKNALTGGTKEKSAEYYINESLRFYNEKKFEECIIACKKALQINTNYDIAYNNICASYNELKQWDKAIEAGNLGIKLNPSNNRLRNNLAFAIQSKNK